MILVILKLWFEISPIEMVKSSKKNNFISCVVGENKNHLLTQHELFFLMGFSGEMTHWTMELSLFVCDRFFLSKFAGAEAGRAMGVRSTLLSGILCCHSAQFSESKGYSP